VVFNASTGELFTAGGVLIKRIDCPKGDAAFGLLGLDSRGRLTCDGCSRRIHDVRLMSEAQVVALVESDPNVCLLLDVRSLSSLK
jgi:hypothetical protein